MIAPSNVPMCSATSNVLFKSDVVDDGTSRRATGTRIRCPELETGANSVTPCVRPSTIACRMVRVVLSVEGRRHASDPAASARASRRVVLVLSSSATATAPDPGSRPAAGRTRRRRRVALPRRSVGQQHDRRHPVAGRRAADAGAGRGVVVEDPHHLELDRHELGVRRARSAVRREHVDAVAGRRALAGTPLATTTREARRAPRPPPVRPPARPAGTA